MDARISIDRRQLVYADGARRLVLPVEWSGTARTADHPVDVEIYAGDMARWTEPAHVPITAAERETILDAIAAYYARAPAADLLDRDGTLLRGVSAFRFYARLHPAPSLYTEVGRRLEIPMARTERGAQRVLDARGLARWTWPDAPLEPGKLDQILARALGENPQLGILR